MIISGGFNIYPSEIEQVLWSIRRCSTAPSIGVPDAKWGEAIKAVVSSSRERHSEDELRESLPCITGGHQNAEVDRDLGNVAAQLARQGAQKRDPREILAGPVAAGISARRAQCNSNPTGAALGVEVTASICEAPVRSRPPDVSRRLVALWGAFHPRPEARSAAFVAGRTVFRRHRALRLDAQPIPARRSGPKSSFCRISRRTASRSASSMPEPTGIPTVHMLSQPAWSSCLYALEVPRADDGTPLGDTEFANMTNSVSGVVTGGTGATGNAFGLARVRVPLQRKECVYARRELPGRL